MIRLKKLLHEELELHKLSKSDQEATGAKFYFSTDDGYWGYANSKEEAEAMVQRGTRQDRKALKSSYKKEAKGWNADQWKKAMDRVNKWKQENPELANAKRAAKEKDAPWLRKQKPLPVPPKANEGLGAPIVRTMDAVQRVLKDKGLRVGKDNKSYSRLDLPKLAKNKGDSGDFHRLVGGQKEVVGTWKFLGNISGDFELRKYTYESVKEALSVPEKHLLKIARANAKMPPQMAAVLGGPDPEEAKKIIAQLTKKDKGLKEVSKERMAQIRADLASGKISQSQALYFLTNPDASSEDEPVKEDSDPMSTYKVIERPSANRWYVVDGKGNPAGFWEYKGERSRENARKQAEAKAAEWTKKHSPTKEAAPGSATMDALARDEKPLKWSPKDIDAWSELLAQFKKDKEQGIPHGLTGK